MRREVTVLQKGNRPLWPTAIVEEVETLVSHWSAARMAVRTVLWPTAPRWLARYAVEMLSAHTHSLAYQRTIGGKLIR